MNESGEHHVLYSLDLGGVAGRAFGAFKKISEPKTTIVDAFFQKESVDPERLECLDAQDVDAVRSFVSNQLAPFAQHGIDLFGEFAKLDRIPKIDSAQLLTPAEAGSLFSMNLTSEYSPEKPIDQATKLIVQMNVDGGFHFPEEADLTTPLGRKFKAISRLIADAKTGVPMHFSSYSPIGKRAQILVHMPVVQDMGSISGQFNYTSLSDIRDAAKVSGVVKTFAKRFIASRGY